MAKLFTVGTDRKLVDRTPDGRGMSMPVGSIMWFGGDDVPESWLLCNGAEVSRTLYTSLFNVIGTTFGQGDGSTTFNLPDLRGRFVQGATVAGDVREAGLPNIEGRFNNLVTYPTATSVVSTMGKALGAFYNTGTPGDVIVWVSTERSVPDGDGISFDASRSSSVYGASNTVQPPAISMVPCIKAYGSVVVTETGGVTTETLLTELARITAQLQEVKTSEVVKSTIIYPNGGSAASPANVTTNQRYVMDNPYPGYFVKCETQVQYNDKWGTTGWYTDLSSTAGNRSYGIIASQLFPDDNIVVQTGNTRLMYGNSSTSGNPFGLPAGTTIPTTLPCRVIVHRMGKM